MKRARLIRKMAMVATIALAGGTAFGNGCINTVASVPWCGGLFTWCDPSDQLNLFYPMLETPDFGTDPSCTIPYGCGDGDLFPVADDQQFPGGGAPEEPADAQGGGAAGEGGG